MSNSIVNDNMASQITTTFQRNRSSMITFSIQWRRNCLIILSYMDRLFLFVSSMLIYHANWLLHCVTFSDLFNIGIIKGVCQYYQYEYQNIISCYDDCITCYEFELQHYYYYYYYYWSESQILYIIFDWGLNVF